MRRSEKNFPTPSEILEVCLLADPIELVSMVKQVDLL